MLLLLHCVCVRPSASTLRTYSTVAHYVTRVTGSIFTPAPHYCCHPLVSFHTTSVALETSDSLTYESIPPLPPFHHQHNPPALLHPQAHTSSPLQSVAGQPVHSLSSGRPAIPGLVTQLVMGENKRSQNAPVGVTCVTCGHCVGSNTWFPAKR